MRADAHLHGAIGQDLLGDDRREAREPCRLIGVDVAAIRGGRVGRRIGRVGRSRVGGA